MTVRPRLLAFAGSLRKESFNKKLIRVAAAGAREAGADVTLIELNDYPLPVFDEDCESREGPPESARKLKALMIQHDGFLLSCPEYNSSITAALKNAVDWASRPAPNEPPLVAFAGKTAALMAASPGTLGGLRGLVHVRAILGNIQVLLLPDQIAVSRAHEAFNPDGSLKDAKQQAAVMNLGRKLADLTARLQSAEVPR
ncbi:MAG: NAD(P)H-dependent oxidoreductase [Phycisphaerae bacterium]|nr:NAD(P)H-dependent oxidoreductase [Phycisphaerae bacterium]NUQ47780.1 NAD(P)H-dependent oxidoreductase [Phycisphaerae bacterium]